MTTLAGLAISFSAGLMAEGDAIKGDAAKGETAVKEKCASCHGADGNSTNPLWPKLAGQHASYIEKQLTDFNAKNRSDPTMSPMAGLLDENGIKDVAAFLSAQTTKPGSADEKLVAAGRLTYKGGNPTSGVTACAACHGPTGLGNPAAKYPSVSGQHAAYLVKQLQDFKEGKRTNDSAIMTSIAKKMTTAEMEAVAQYMSGLH